MLVTSISSAEVNLSQEGWDGWLLTQVGSALDAAILQAMNLAIDATLMPEPEEISALRASAQRFLEGKLWEDPRHYFEFVDRPIAVTPSASRYRRVIRGGVVVAREFISAYQPYHADSCPDFEGDRILVEHWIHDQRAPIGLLGLSLGGYLSALMSSLTDNWGFVIAMVPPVCIGDLAWRFNSRSRRYRRGETPRFPPRSCVPVIGSTRR